MNKKQIRNIFRNQCFQRDRNKCVKCNFVTDTSKPIEEQLDAHHITDRKQMPAGGYVKENGISLCNLCHIKAEAFHSTGVSITGYSPEDLYKAIESSYELAYQMSLKLTE
jgi:HNH endonuclease